MSRRDAIENRSGYWFDPTAHNAMEEHEGLAGQLEGLKAQQFAARMLIKKWKKRF